MVDYEWIDLTYTQHIAMMVLWEHKTINVKAMGDILYLDSGAMAPVWNKLESKGFIICQRSTTEGYPYFSGKTTIS